MEKNERRKPGADIDIVPLLKALLAKLWLMLIVGAVVGACAFGFTKLFVKPVYRSGFTAYVNNQLAQNDKVMLSNQDLIAAQQLTKTYRDIICSNTVLSATLDNIDSDLTYDEFSGMVFAESKDETELISVFVYNKDPQLATDLAEAIAKTAPGKMSDIVEGSSMKIVDNPVYPKKPYGPSYFKYALLGFFIGALLVAIYVIVRYFRNDTIMDESELEQRFSMPVFGVIPDINETSKNSASYYRSNYGYGNSEQQRKENEA